LGCFAQKDQREACFAGRLGLSRVRNARGFFLLSDESGWGISQRGPFQRDQSSRLKRPLSDNGKIAKVASKLQRYVNRRLDVETNVGFWKKNGRGHPGLRRAIDWASGDVCEPFS